MKIVELTGHLNQTIQLPITNEEYDLLNKFSGDSVVARKDLSEREVQVANQLVNKDVLYRKNQDGSVTYKKKKASG